MTDSVVFRYPGITSRPPYLSNQGGPRPGFRLVIEKESFFEMFQHNFRATFYIVGTKLLVYKLDSYIYFIFEPVLKGAFLSFLMVAGAVSVSMTILPFSPRIILRLVEFKGISK